MAKILESDIAGLKDKIDILTLFSNLGIQLHKKGATYWCCCPIHNEKTPSFAVYPDKKTWHCYGCGRGGDAIALLMELQHLNFNEALLELGRMFNYEFTKPENADPKEEEKQRVKRALIEINKAALHWFKNQLHNPANAAALEYVRSRWNDESIEHWDIGYAPKDGSFLWDDLVRQGFKAEALIQSSLFKRDDKDKPYCVFRSRVIMPVFDNLGQPIAFCGRLFPTPPPQLDAGGNLIHVAKYINTSTDILYSKSEAFYGWNFAQRDIRRGNEAVIVEGNPDVIHLHQIGITNVVAACGTALAKGHIDRLKKNCLAVVLLYDSDTAGQNNMERNGQKLLEAGITPYTLTVPDAPDGSKQDPDSFFSDPEHYRQFYQANKRHWILWYAARHKDDYRDPTDIANFMGRVCQFLLLLNEAEALGYLNQLAKIIPDKTLWTAAFNTERRKHNAIDTKERFGFTEEQDSTLQRYGFLIDNNSYFVFSGSSEHGKPKQVSNFTLKPLFMICSSVNAKRIFTMTNCYGYTVDIEISQADFGGRASFRKAVGSRGNFFFSGKDDDLDKITAYLMDNTKNCIIIEQLGWQPQPKFWAWSNGILTASGQFIPVDEQGTVEYDGQWYYLPALSSTTADDEGFYQFERRFVHQSSDADLLLWADKFIAAYGDNAIIGISYAIACLFRDIAFNRLRSFPLLNLFGQPKTGKTKFVISLLNLFGMGAIPGPSLETGSKAAISDHMSKLYNGFVHLDEYKNNIAPEIIGLLKGAYESRGRVKMDMDRDKKRMQTAVDCGLVVSGQEKTTADPALFSRTIYLTFERDHFTKEEEETFRDLKDYEESRSLTPITHHILAKRDIVANNFYDAFKEVKEVLRQQMTVSRLDGRIFESYATVLASLPNVTTECIGFCASAATVIFMAGKERHIAKNALFLIHKCSSYAYGNENEIQRTLQEQQTINETIRSTYIDAGVSSDTVDELMSANNGQGRWISAADALQFGFATAISSTSGTTNAYNAADFQDAHLPLPDSIDEFSPSLMNRIRNYIQELIKPKTTMPENNTNLTNTAQPTAEQQIQTLTAERDQARNERDQAITERDQARTERDQAVAERDSLQAIIDQTPTTTSNANGDDEPAPEDPVSDFISNSPAYQAIKEELYN